MSRESNFNCTKIRIDQKTRIFFRSKNINVFEEFED